MKISAALGLEPSIIACVGAGGKTSLLLTLANELITHRKPLLLTSTTKMFFNQVQALNPIITANPQQGWYLVQQRIAQGQPAAWFRARQEDKVVGLEPAWLEIMPSGIPYILVEADGAGQRLIKAPAVHEPVVPRSSTMTIGVLNIQAVGQPCTEATVHRMTRVLEITGLRRGQKINLEHIALLAGHPQGIFKASVGRKVLVVNGWKIDGQDVFALPEMLQSHNLVGIERYVLTSGDQNGLSVIQSGLLT